MSNLVNELLDDKHPVTMTRYKNSDELKEAIEQNFVLVKFIGTKGWTEVGFNLDAKKSSTNLDDAREAIKLVGKFNSDYADVECIVDIQKNSLEGSGCLRCI